eukprot:superscaffoldBa00001907_g12473
MAVASPRLSSRRHRLTHKHTLRGRGGAWSSTREALGVEAQGSPEGTARLEDPLAGQQLNKRWEGSVSLEGQERWEGPMPCC